MQGGSTSKHLARLVNTADGWRKRDGISPGWGMDLTPLGGWTNPFKSA
jgi:hypothetical protein